MPTVIHTFDCAFCGKASERKIYGRRTIPNRSFCSNECYRLYLIDNAPVSTGRPRTVGTASWNKRVEQKVVALLRTHESLTISQLSVKTGATALSRPALFAVLARMEEDGRVVRFSSRRGYRVMLASTPTAAPPPVATPVAAPEPPPVRIRVPMKPRKRTLISRVFDFVFAK